MLVDTHGHRCFSANSLHSQEDIENHIDSGSKFHARAPAEFSAAVCLGLVLALRKTVVCDGQF